MTVVSPIPRDRRSSKWRSSLSSRWGAFCALGLMVCIISALVIFPRIGSSPFTGDESDWISAGYYYTGLVRSGDFSWQKWACPECGPWGKINLPLGKWLMGIPLVADPVTRAEPYLAHYNFTATVDENRRAGAVPRPEILSRARTAPAFFGVLCCLLLFAIGFWAYNAWIGLIAASLLLGNSVFLLLASQAMTDTFYNFFLLSCCLTLVGLSKTADKKRALLIVCVCGVLTGLACSVKPTGILLGGAVFLLAVIHRYYLHKAGKRDVVSFVALFSVCALATVYILNPVFWPSWREMRGKAILHEVRSFSSEIVASKRMPSEHDAVTSVATRYPQLRNLANVLEFPAVFLRFDHSMQRQYALGWGNWHGNRLLSVNRALFSLGPPFQASESKGQDVNTVALLWVVLTGAGILFVWRGERLALCESPDDSHLVPLLYLLVNYLLIVVFLKLNWNRYYLPTIIGVDLIAAAGLYRVASWARQYLVIRLTMGMANRTSPVSNPAE